MCTTRASDCSSAWASSPEKLSRKALASPTVNTVSSSGVSERGRELQSSADRPEGPQGHLFIGTEMALSHGAFPPGGIWGNVANPWPEHNPFHTSWSIPGTLHTHCTTALKSCHFPPVLLSLSLLQITNQRKVAQKRRKQSNWKFPFLTARIPENTLDFQTLMLKWGREWEAN